ncbi:MAG: hydrogenase expression/formation protein HypE [Anaerolineaceae bacterium]|nr:hydrogenase expression/formation protein HypE [Anaerolineaceae bacterium]
MQGPACPLPLKHDEQIVMGHGSGGRMTHDLVKKIFQPFFSNPALDSGNDFASLPSQNGRLSISTDAHIVQPLFFSGGDIGRLAVCGTVNDIAMSGAKPQYLTAGFILEEGLSFDVLQRVVSSMQAAAAEAGISIVAGDTKVVEKGKADGLFITTAGVGFIEDGVKIGGEMAQPGDVVIISGTIGDHGIAVLNARGELGFEAEIASDVCPLNHLINEVLAAAPHTHVLRDPTRGGLATSLNEIALQSKVNILLDEKLIPVQKVVQTICDMLGFDPMYVANEGKVIIILPEAEVADAMQALKNNPYGKNAVCIGKVEAAAQNNTGRVLMRTTIGGTRIVDMLSGEILPRIC